MQHYLIPYGELLILQGSGSIRRTNRQNCTATVVSFALALRRLSNQVADLDDVAPVTPHSAEIEQNKARPSFFACAKTESDQSGQRNSQAGEEFGDFSDIGKLSLAGKKKLPEEVETQWRPQKVSAG